MDIMHNIQAALVFAVIGIVVFVAAFVIIDKMTPYRPVEGDRRGEEHGAGGAESARCRSASASSSPPRCTEPVSIALFLSILLVAACGLIYELIAGTVASYLVGDSVFQFSTVIGTYLFAMGIGSFLSRFIRGSLARAVRPHRAPHRARRRLLVERCCSWRLRSRRVSELLLYLIVLVVGTLVGLEIPLLMRIVKDRYQFRRRGCRTC